MHFGILHSGQPLFLFHVVSPEFSLSHGLAVWEYAYLSHNALCT